MHISRAARYSDLLISTSRFISLHFFFGTLSPICPQWGTADTESKVPSTPTHFEGLLIRQVGEYLHSLVVESWGGGSVSYRNKYNWYTSTPKLSHSRTIYPPSQRVSPQPFCRRVECVCVWGGGVGCDWKMYNWYFHTNTVNTVTSSQRVS